MPIFNYVAIDQNRQTKVGSGEYRDKTEAIESLKKQGLQLISLKETASQKTSSRTSWLGGKRVKPKHLVVFTRQLSTMVGAGVPLLRSLSALTSHTPKNSYFKKVLLDIIKDVEGGASLSVAMGKHPQIFNNVYTNMVKAGETGGILDAILNRLAQEQEKNSSIRKKIKGAMAYPTVLMIVTVVAFFGLMIFVIPQIGKVISDFSGGQDELPKLTLMMLAISNFITGYWYVLIPTAILAIILIVLYIKSRTGRKQFDRFILKIPLINTILTKLAIARFARTFSALTEAGVSVLETLDVTSKAVGNYVYEQALLDAKEKIKNGAILSRVIASNQLFPPIVAQMLAVGEETGQTDKVLVKIADFYEEEVDTALNNLSTIIEPLMIVIMGSLVGLVAASVMIPITSISKSIK